jgi:hypothetical protein
MNSIKPAGTWPLEDEIKNDLQNLEEEPCLIRAYFEHEAEKPAHLRKSYCHISCPCSRCSPGVMKC